MSPPRSTRRRWILGLAKFAILALVLWAVSGTLAHGWQQLRQSSWPLQPGWLVVAGGLYLLGLLPAGLFWHRALRVLGQDARLSETLRAYFIGHLGKYVPGKALVIVLRTGLIQSQRVQPGIAAVSVFLETMTMMSSGALLAAAILAVWFREQTGLMLVALGLMVAAGLPTLPPVFRRLVRLVGVGRGDPAIGERLARLGYGTLAVGWGLMLVGWVLLGLSLWAVLRAMRIEGVDALAHLPLMTACVSLAMVAGFLSLIPGGLGVREAVVMQLMVPYFTLVVHVPAAEAAAVLSAVLLRLVWLVAELIASGVLYVGVRRQAGERGEGIGDREERRGERGERREAREEGRGKRG